MLCMNAMVYAQEADSVSTRDSTQQKSNIIVDSAGTQPQKNNALSDTSNNTSTPKTKKPPYMRQFRIGVDIARIPMNFANPSKQGYELQLDYILRNNLYVVAETGYGRGNIDYSFLKYTANSTFVKFGVDKQILDIISDTDFDIAFIGIRYGAGYVRRNEATYLIENPFGGLVAGTIPAKNQLAHWGELNGGLKVEIWPKIFLGYNVRMRFLLNAKAFDELAPNYIAGYGRADAPTAFDFNFYLSYALRWKQ